MYFSSFRDTDMSQTLEDLIQRKQGIIFCVIYTIIATIEGIRNYVMSSSLIGIIVPEYSGFNTRGIKCYSHKIVL